MSSIVDEVVRVKRTTSDSYAGELVSAPDRRLDHEEGEDQDEGEAQLALVAGTRPAGRRRRGCVGSTGTDTYSPDRHGGADRLGRELGKRAR